MKKEKKENGNTSLHENVRRRLRCRDGPHKGRRYHPRAHLLGVHAADRRSAHLSCDGHVLYLAGREIREEAAQQ